jgi:glycine/D-amino acid oxidase-like deaminating enzyme
MAKLMPVEQEPAAAAAPAPLRRSIYWRETEPVEPGPPLEREVRCDVCIVGGGYTGLWTAHFLKQAEPTLDIHVVEADYAGAGASGHNDGFVTPTIGHSLHTVVNRCGPEAAKASYAAVGRSIMELRRFCDRNEIDAELEPNGFFLVATNDAQLRRLEGDVKLAARMGVSYEVLSAAEVRERIDSPQLRAGLKTPGALVNPHRLARGLLRVVRAAGVEVHERSPAIEVGREGGARSVRTPHGRVLADRLVLATNAYQHQWQPFRSRVKPVWSYAMVSEPLDEARLEQVHWPGREGFVEACNFILFGRLTAQNRLLIGGGPAPYFYGRDMDENRIASDVAVPALREALARYFPVWRDVRFTHAYGGCIAVTRDLVPHVGEDADGVLYGYGYCGNGIAMTHTAGKALRDLVLGRESAYSRLLFVRGREPRFPPEPVAYAGVRGLSALLRWQDHHPRLLKRQLV